MSPITKETFSLIAEGIKEIETQASKEIKCIRIDIDESETHYFVNFVPTSKQAQTAPNNQDIQFG
jgi:hypothetical protein